MSLQTQDGLMKKRSFKPSFAPSKWRIVPKEKI